MQKYSTQRYYTYTSHKQPTTKKQNKNRKKIHKIPEQLPRNFSVCMFLSCPNRLCLLNFKSPTKFLLGFGLLPINSEKAETKQSMTSNFCNPSLEACTREGFKKKKNLDFSVLQHYPISPLPAEPLAHPLARIRFLCARAESLFQIALDQSFQEDYKCAVWTSPIVPLR